MEGKATLKENTDRQLLIQKKRLTVQEFMRRLLASTVGNSVVKVVLYGSVQKGYYETGNRFPMYYVLEAKRQAIQTRPPGV